MKKRSLPRPVPLPCPSHVRMLRVGATLGLKWALGFEQECVLTDPLQRTMVGNRPRTLACSCWGLGVGTGSCLLGLRRPHQLCFGLWAAPWLLKQRPAWACAALPSRLLQYFRGRHHLEEIMYNENTRRSQLLMLFDKFRSVLVVTTHEDPVIAVFQALLT